MWNWKNVGMVLSNHTYCTVICSLSGSFCGNLSLHDMLLPCAYTAGLSNWFFLSVVCLSAWWLSTQNCYFTIYRVKPLNTQQ